MKKFIRVMTSICAIALLSGCVSSLPGDSSISSEITSMVSSITTSETSSVSSGSQLPEGISWVGIDDAIVQLGDPFDLMEGVHAYDSVDGELTVTIVDDDYFSYNYVSSYTITYEATNSRSTKSTQLRTIMVIKGVNVQNGAFEFGKAYWTFDVPGGSGTFNVINQEAVINVTAAGTEAWAVQLYQTGLQFTAGKTYELSFLAKSNYGRSVSAGFENVSNNYAMLVPGYQAMRLTNTWSTYSVLCTPEADIGFVKAVVYLGQNLEIDAEARSNNPIDITIDDIRVREYNVAPAASAPVFSNAGNATVSTKDQFDALTPVTAVDYLGADISSSIVVVGQVPNSVNAQTGMMVSYRVTDSYGNFGYVNRRVYFVLARDNPYNLINDEFTNGLQGWTQDVNQTNGTGAATFTPVDGTIVINITNGSNANWHIQLFQSQVSLTNGHTYKTIVRAKASTTRTLVIEVSNPSASFAVIASRTINLTTEFQEFELEFTSSVTTTAKFSLLLAHQGNNVVTIDSFKNDRVIA